MNITREESYIKLITEALENKQKCRARHSSIYPINFVIEGELSMSKDHFAAEYKAISRDNLLKLCPKEMKAIENHEIYYDKSFKEPRGWGLIAAGLAVKDEKILPIKPLIQELQWAFTNITRVSGSELQLELEYYYEDDNTPIHEIEHYEGCIFKVLNTFNMTPAAKAIAGLLVAY